ncbi:MAG: hypothetical protein KAS30_03520, partial [Candidatus Diapherotrites archaeon]|nr:hypothetical protein [Candidatus Diapherotrites archaeon]
MISDENKSVITTMLKKLREVKKTEAEIKAILIQAGFIDAEIESLIKLNPHPSPEEKLEFLKREMQNNPEPEQEVPKSFFEQNTPETPLEQKTTVPENTMPEPETTPKPNIPTQTPINNPKQNEQKNIEFSLPPLDKKVFGNEAEKEVPEDDFLKPTSQKPEQQTPEFILDSSSTHPTTNPIPSTQEKTTEFQTLPSTPSTIPTSSTIPSATPSTTPTATPSTTPTSTPSIPPAPSQSQNQPQQNSNLNLNPTKHFEDPLDSHKKGNTKTNPLNSNIVKIGLIAIITLIIIIAFIGMTGLGNTTATTSTPNNNNLNL